MIFVDLQRLWYMFAVFLCVLTMGVTFVGLVVLVIAYCVTAHPGPEWKFPIDAAFFGLIVSMYCAGLLSMTEDTGREWRQ